MMGKREKVAGSRRKPRPIIKRRNWRDALNALKSNETYEDLAKIERNSKPLNAAEERRDVPIKNLVIAEKVFQWRGEHSDLLAEDRLMRELMRALELGQQLEPILVKRLGSKLYVIDGHHRLAAYAALRKMAVPVVNFSGNLRAAYLKSLDTNIRDKLSITRKDKMEAAFRLVKHKMQYADVMTWADIARRAVVSERLVYKMQALLRANPEARDWSWGKTLGQAQSGEADYLPGSDEFRDEYARKLADQIMSKVGVKFIQNPDITAKALAMISEGLPRALIEEWNDEVMEALIDRAREVDSEEAEHGLKVAFEQLDRARDQASDL